MAYWCSIVFHLSLFWFLCCPLPRAHRILGDGPLCSPRFPRGGGVAGIGVSVLLAVVATLLAKICSRVCRFVLLRMGGCFLYFFCRVSSCWSGIIHLFSCGILWGGSLLWSSLAIKVMCPCPVLIGKGIGIIISIPVNTFFFGLKRSKLWYVYIFFPIGFPFLLFFFIVLCVWICSLKFLALFLSLFLAIGAFLFFLIFFFFRLAAGGSRYFQVENYEFGLRSTFIFWYKKG